LKWVDSRNVKVVCVFFCDDFQLGIEGLDNKRKTNNITTVIHINKKDRDFLLNTIDALFPNGCTEGSSGGNKEYCFDCDRRLLERVPALSKSFPSIDMVLKKKKRQKEKRE
jgi:hypothetical protein